jgi:hypothetical protein
VKPSTKYTHRAGCEGCQGECTEYDPKYLGNLDIIVGKQYLGLVGGVDVSKNNKSAPAEVSALTGEWEEITVTADSGAGNNVAPRKSFPWIPLQPNDDSRAGRYYIAANGKKVYVLGEKIVTLRMPNGKLKRMRFHIADVTRILASVGKITDAGNEVRMRKSGGEIVDPKGEKFPMQIENGVYVIKCQVKVEMSDASDLCFRRQEQ